MIFIAMGANLPHPEYGDPINTLIAASKELQSREISVDVSSSWYRTAPVPASDQPWFVNSVLQVSWGGTPEELLAVLHEIEEKFGRVRVDKWEARILDLDLLAFKELVTENQCQAEGLVLPHPLMQERAFVMVPLAELAPDWQHPCFRQTAAALAKSTANEQPFELVKSNQEEDFSDLP